MTITCLIGVAVSLSRDELCAGAPAAKLLPTANWKIKIETSPVRTTCMAADERDFTVIKTSKLSWKTQLEEPYVASITGPKFSGEFRMNLGANVIDFASHSSHADFMECSST